MRIVVQDISSLFEGCVSNDSFFIFQLGNSSIFSCRVNADDWPISLARFTHYAMAIRELVSFSILLLSLNLMRPTVSRPGVGITVFKKIAT